MSVSSSTSKGKLLFNVDSLKELLGTSGAGKGKDGKGKPRKQAGMKKPKSNIDLFQTILKEETGSALNFKRYFYEKDPLVTRKHRILSNLRYSFHLFFSFVFACTSFRKKQSKLKVKSKSILGLLNQSVQATSELYEQAKARRKAQNNIFSFAAAFGVNGDDTTYLERQFSKLKKQVRTAEGKLREGYSVRTWNLFPLLTS